jgi:uncharacterized iron-regulated membrane protein
MMRRYHRWLGIVFGLFLLWISATGVLSQIGEYVNHNANASAAPVAAPPGFVCPESMTCRPKAQPGPWNLGLLHHLHSGESLGPVGQLISTLSGLSLFFFALSGLWMYLQMWRGRMVRVEAGKRVRGGKWFWK